MTSLRYQLQLGANVARVNAMKVLEERVLRALNDLAAQGNANPRWFAIGRTQIEQGFMAVNRSVFRPGRVSLSEDGDA